MTLLLEKLVFITGGSSGIGFATAKLLASKGCDLVLFARGKEMLDKAIADLQQQRVNSSQRFHGLSMDVADPEGVKLGMKSAIEQFGTPEILINSAGISSGDYFENITYDQFDRVMKVNLYGARNTISAILPYMKETGRGHIVNISSVAGLIAMFGYTLYSTSKYALVGFTEALRAELKRYNIQVSLICPPEVRTPLLEEEAKTLPPESRAVKSLAGLLDPEDVATAILDAITRKRFLVIPGFLAKSLLFFHRISNGHLTRLPADWIIRFATARAKYRR
jgi:short-subunit dehydrogenase